MYEEDEKKFYIDTEKKLMVLIIILWLKCVH